MKKSNFKKKKKMVYKGISMHSLFTCYLLLR